MKIGNILNSLITELFNTPFKGKNVLFHSTTFGRAIDIIDSNQIWDATKQTIKTKLSPNNPNYNEQSKTFNGVSLTRNYALKFSDVQFILNGDLIKRDYGKSLVPFDFFDVDGRKHDPTRSTDNESEEFLVGPLNNVSKYVMGIRILKVNQSLQSFYEEDREGYYILKKAIGQVPLYDENFKKLYL